MYEYKVKYYKYKNKYLKLKKQVGGSRYDVPDGYVRGPEPTAISESLKGDITAKPAVRTISVPSNGKLLIVNTYASLSGGSYGEGSIGWIANNIKEKLHIQTDIPIEHINVPPSYKLLLYLEPS